MFNRRVAIFLILLALTLSMLYLSWNSPVSPALPAGSAAISAERWQLSLEGKWQEFPSVRTAWTTESQSQPVKPRFSFLSREKNISLPSATEFAVAARKFKIPAEWSARTMQLVLSGVDGQVQVFLNGIGDAHEIGKFEGYGGTNRLDIPAGAFQYGTDNTLILELSAGSQQRSVLLGSAWPAEGKITGQLALEAVMESSLTTPQVSEAWQGATAQVSVQTLLVHHSSLGRGPWTVSAVLSDGSAGVARATANVQAGENEAQSVTLHLTVSQAHRWSLQDPFLYQLHLTLVNSAGDQDDLAFPIGLRSVSMTGGKILLNGQPLSIRGVALGPGAENQIRQEGKIASFLKAERQGGVNLIYFVGPPPDPLWLQAADQIGMGVWAEFPVGLTPNARLPVPSVFAAFAAADNNFPSVWAWTVGKDLDPKAPAEYFSQAERSAAPNLAFIVRDKAVLPAGVPLEKAATIQDGSLQGSWGSIVPLQLPSADTAAQGTASGPSAKDFPGSQRGAFSLASVLRTSHLPGTWPGKGLVLGWGVFVLFVTWMSLRAASWRYKEIEEKRPKRRLRQAWFWHGLSVLVRAGTLAGILSTAVFMAPSGLGFWFPQLWPALTLIQEQNPWLIWLALGLTLVLLRLLQAGLAAPQLPGSPHPLGLVLWLEQRYRWLVIAAGLWLGVDWGLSWLGAFLAYVGLSLVFLPWRIRDVHRVGGRYRVFLYIPGLFVFIFLVWFVGHTADWLYLWHLLRNPS